MPENDVCLGQMHGGERDIITSTVELHLRSAQRQQNKELNNKREEMGGGGQQGVSQRTCKFSK